MVSDTRTAPSPSARWVWAWCGWIADRSPERSARVMNRGVWAYPALFLVYCVLHMYIYFNIRYFIPWHVCLEQVDKVFS